MNLCGWWKIFRRKNAVNDSGSDGPDEVGNKERRTAGSKSSGKVGGSSTSGSRSGAKKSGGSSATGKKKIESEASVSEDDWGEVEAEADADAESEAGNPRNKTALKPGHSLMHWIRLGNSGVDLAGTGGKVRPVNYAELATHNKPDDIWMAIRGKVYNVTRYLDFHPGGVDELMRGAGKDATRLFEEVHAFVNYESLLAKCYIGPLRSTGVLHLVPEEPAEPSFLKPPAPSNPSVIVTPSSPSIRALKTNSANSIVSSSSEDSASTTSSVVPRFDWIQKTAEVTFIFYTKPLCNPAVVVEFVNNLELNVQLFVEGNVRHRYHFQVANNLQWPCTVRQSLEAGKVELVFNKLLPGLWTTYGQMDYKRSENYPLELYEYDVATRLEITHDSCALLLRPKNNSILQVIPIGHHLTVSGTVPGGQVVTRSYTPVPANAIPTDCPATFVPLLVKTYQLGSLSKHLTRPVPLATSLLLSQPSGNFSLAKLKHHNRIALLAAGSGITPMLALLNYLLERSSNKMEALSLLYFNKTEADIWCREMLDNLCTKDKRLTVMHYLSEAEHQSAACSPGPSRAPLASSPPAATSSTTTEAKSPSPSSVATATLERGRISLAIAQQLTNVDSPLWATFVCLCGPKPFNELTIQHLEQAGFNMSHVHSFQG